MFTRADEDIEKITKYLINTGAIIESERITGIDEKTADSFSGTFSLIRILKNPKSDECYYDFGIYCFGKFVRDQGLIALVQHEGVYYHCTLADNGQGLGVEKSELKGGVIPIAYEGNIGDRLIYPTMMSL